MSSDGAGPVDVELRRALEAVGEHPPIAGEVVGGTAQVEAWLDAGELGLAYQDLVAIAEDTAADPPVWHHLQRVQQLLGLIADGSEVGLCVASVDAAVERAVPLQDRPAPPAEVSVRLRGGATIGLFRASPPLASIEISVDRVVVTVVGLSRETARRGTGRIIVKDGWGGATIRLEDEGRRGGISFGSWNHAHVMDVLEQFGWGDAIVGERRRRDPRG